MRSSGRVIRAIVLRELAGYFSTPTGYVFIALFVFLSALAAFWQDAFFAANLANLEQLNRLFPYLLLFLLPAVAMSLWAEERKHGTEELLLTLPASDWQVVAGKYLAGLAIYTAALIFSLSHVLVLVWLGSPDLGLTLSTYAGYWLAGAALLALAMLASLMTDNLTVAFILGALFCSIPVFLDKAGVILSGAAERLAMRLSLVDRFSDLAAGTVTPGAVVYFLGLAAAALYANMVLLGRKRWPVRAGEPRLGYHFLFRCLFLGVAVCSLALLASRSAWRWDTTSERIHTLAAETRQLLLGLDARRPVFVHAYISPEVPRSYLEARSNLVALLREFDAVAGERLHARVVSTLKYTPEAREAQERYDIRPQRLPATEESAHVVNEIFLGLAFTCGTEEFVIPFFDRGLSPEYELMRSIRVVSGASRRKVGVLDTPARLFGGFDYQRRAQAGEWSVVAELRKQYEVVAVTPDAEYAEDIDVLLAVAPSTLTPPQVDRLAAYARTGRPLLLLLDPMPAFNLELAPQEIAEAPSGFGPTGRPAARADLRPLLDAVGIAWQPNRIVWDSHNPHPQLRHLPKEFVFLGSQGFQAAEAVSSGLQEMVLLYPGTLRPREGASAEFVPLLESTEDSGLIPWGQLVQRSLFGVALNQNPQRVPDQRRHILAAKVKGAANAIVVADADWIGEQFFEMRRRGLAQLSFDNVTFVLNAVDALAGDTSFIALRKRRPRHRTLEAVEDRTRTYEARRRQETEQAEAIAEERLREAQARLDRAVAEIQRRPGLDEQTRQIMISNVEAVESRRLTVARTTIEDEKLRQIELSRAEMENSIRRIQSTIKLMAVVLPPIPAFLVFLAVSVRRLRRERIGVPADRLVEGGAR